MTISKAVARTKRTLHVTSLWTQAAVLLAGLLAPLALLTGNAFAAGQLSSRSVAISDSTISVTTTYLLTFTTTASTTIQSVMMQACTTPLGTCTAPTGGTNNAGATGTFTGSNAGNFARQTTTLGACTVAANQWCGTRTQVTAEGIGVKTLSIPSQVNPSTTGSFYLRITTFTDAAFAAPAASGQDYGVVAASTAANLTISAQVQESLTFCVGTTTVNDATTDPGACPIGGTSVNLGTLTAAAHNFSIPRTDAGSPATNGIAELSTNANNGTTVSYFSVLNGSSGTLKVITTACAGSTAYVGGSKTDICFNDTATQTLFNTITTNEGFGMTVAGTNCVHTTAYTCSYVGGTHNLKAVAQYQGGGASGAGTTGAPYTYGTGNGFAWNDAGTTSSIASSTTVVDSEALILKFDAWPVATTPAKPYTVTAVFIVTSTY